jgi:hypothetical protein
LKSCAFSKMPNSFSLTQWCKLKCVDDKQSRAKLRQDFPWLRSKEALLDVIRQADEEVREWFRAGDEVKEAVETIFTENAEKDTRAASPRGIEECPDSPVLAKFFPPLVKEVGQTEQIVGSSIACGGPAVAVDFPQVSSEGKFTRRVKLRSRRTAKRLNKLRSRLMRAAASRGPCKKEKEIEQIAAVDVTSTVNDQPSVVRPVIAKEKTPQRVKVRSRRMSKRLCKLRARRRRGATNSRECPVNFTAEHIAQHRRWKDTLHDFESEAILCSHRVEQMERVAGQFFEWLVDSSQEDVI